MNILKLLLNFIFNVIFQYIGAFVKWAFSGFKKKWKDILDDPISNVTVGQFFVGLSAIVLIIIFRS
jgi:hypothetical protein